MGYATQQDTPVPVPQHPNFEEALKVYQAEVKRLQEEKRLLLQEKIGVESEISSLLSSRDKLTSDCATLKKNADDLGGQIRREVLQAEQDIAAKRSALVAEIETREKKLAEDQSALKAAWEKYHGAKTLLDERETEINARSRRINEVTDRLAQDAEQIGKLKAETEKKNAEVIELEASLMKKDVDLKLVSEQLATEAERQKVRRVDLDKKSADLRLLSDDLSARLEQVSGLEAEQVAFAKTKADFEAARDALAEKQASFEAARDRLAVREMAVAEAESQMKNWENDLKQREKLLAEKYKEKKP